MKNLYLLIFMIVIISCAEKKHNIEILEDYDKIYESEEFLKIFPSSLTKEFSKIVEIELKEIVGEIIEEEDEEFNKLIFSYRIYINENGIVDKIKRNKIPPLEANVYSDFDKLTQKVLPIMYKWKFKPAKVENAVKSRFDFYSRFLIQQDDSIYTEIPPFFYYYSKNNDNDVKDVDEMPSPIGGIKGIQSKIKYPELAKRAGVQGRVYIKAYVDQEGNVVETEILKGIGVGCDEAAIKAVQETKFTPGMKNGKPVKVQVSIPILFKLN